VPGYALAVAIRVSAKRWRWILADNDGESYTSCASAADLLETIAARAC
jgi:hypothetical protein